MTDDDHPAHKSPFLPGEITLLVEHKTVPTKENLRNWLTVIADNAKVEFDLPDDLLSTMIPLTLLPAQQTMEKSASVGEAFAAEQADAQPAEKAPQSLIHLKLKTDIYDDLPQDRRQEPTKEQEDKLLKKLVLHDKDIAKKINTLNDDRLTTLSNDDIGLLAAAPNWMFGGSPHTIWDGHPGGRPVGVRVPTNKNKVQFDSQPVQAVIDTIHNHVVMPQTVAAPKRTVNVIILDTIPAFRDFSPTNVKNTITGALLDPIDNNFPGHTLYATLKPKLKEVIRAGKMGITLPKTPEEDSYVHYTHKDGYKMSDHGSFIAGIVHTHAPDANIYLVEVLNAYGVGSTDTIVRAITYVTQNVMTKFPAGSALIVNCSLSIGFLDFAALEAAGLTPHENSDGTKDHRVLLQPIRTALDLLKSTADTLGIELQVTAASGNDSGIDPNTKKFDPSIIMPARYPAAFPDVIGVGSCDDQNQRSWYSNKADAPSLDGVLVYGGKSSFDPVTKKETSEYEDGILGMYVGTMPDGSDSLTGWARWSGTSFATAVMSGMLAYAAGQGIPINLDKLDNFYGSFKTLGDPPINGERIVYTKQGP